MMFSEMNYKNVDFIGDVHAGYSKLTGILKSLGYIKHGKTYSNIEERKLCFLGDIINIGPDNLKVVNLIKGLCSEGKAVCIAGNHEFALYRYWKSYPHFFEQRQIPNNFQIYIPFLNEIKNNAQFTEIMKWFGTMPLVVSNNYFTAVHAYWEENYLKILKDVLSDEMNVFDAERIYNDSTNPVRSIIFNIVYGRRMTLPGLSDNFQNQRVRYRWWDTHEGHRFTDVIFSGKRSEDLNNYVPDSYFTKNSSVPVFFGHYWLKTLPFLTCSKFCCLDFGGSKGGNLTAYRFDGKSILSDQNLLFC